MMAKHQISHNARNLIAYCLRVGYHSDKLEKTRPRVILSNLCPPTKNVKVLTAQIQGANNMRKTDRVHHLIFAHPKTDVKRVSEVGQAKLINEVLDELEKKGINLRDTPFVVIAHTDKDNHIDYHLIAASTDLKGKPIKDSYIGSRAMRAANQISKKYGLSLNNDREKKKKIKETPKRATKAEPEKINFAEEIKLAELSEIEIDTSKVTTAKGAEFDQVEMAGEKIDRRRAEKKAEEEAKLAEKLKHFNAQCDYLGLTEEEKVDVWTGHRVPFQAGRRIERAGVTNDIPIYIGAKENAEGDKMNLFAVVGGVVKGIMEWIREIAERLKKQQDDTTRRKSQQEAQEQERRRGRGFKR